MYSSALLDWEEGIIVCAFEHSMAMYASHQLSQRPLRHEKHTLPNAPAVKQRKSTGPVGYLSAFHPCVAHWELLRYLKTHLNGVVALGEVPQLLGGLLGDEVGLVLGQSPADGAGLLGAEVEGQVLLALVEDAELSALVGVDDGEDASDRLADVVAVTQDASVY